MPQTNPVDQATHRIALVTSRASSALRLRRELIIDLIRLGHQVLCVTGPASERELRSLHDLGVEHRDLPFFRSDLPLLTDWHTELTLAEIFAAWAPSIVMGFGVKPMAAAALTASRSRVQRIVSVVTGLDPGGALTINPRRLAQALEASHAVVFHNRDDKRRLEERGVLPVDRAGCLVVPGSGVDIRRFAATPLPPSEKGINFLMLARLDRQRGVLEYAAAARDLKTRIPTARLRLAGPDSDGRTAIKAAAVVKASGEAIEYLGDLDDVRPALAACHVLVYPSHAEGMPRAILEGLAAGRPVITTDTPGCRETIDDRASGCFVPPGNAAALARAMETFVHHQALTPAMARAARLKAERRFDCREVNQRIIGVLLPNDRGARSTKPPTQTKAERDVLAGS